MPLAVQAVNGLVLASLTEQDLENMGVSKTPGRTGPCGPCLRSLPKAIDPDLVQQVWLASPAGASGALSARQGSGNASVLLD